MPTYSYTLPYTRFVKQVTSPLSAITDTVGIAEQNSESIEVTPWQIVTEVDSTLPVHSATQTTGHSNAYDAVKFCGDYADGKQKAYATAVAYRYQVPVEALAVTVAKLVNLVIPLNVDRWLVAGARISAYQSDDATPTTTWSTIREGDIYEDAVLPIQTPRVDQSGDITLTLASATNAKKYIYVFVTLENYADTRGYWIEGSARIVGNAVSIGFDREVTEDSEWDGRYIASGYFLATTYKDNNHQILNTSTSVLLPQVLALYPTLGSPTGTQTWTQFAGNTGAVIGVNTGGNVYGAISVRYLMMSSETYTKMSFSNAALLPLAGKTVSFLMTLWASTLGTGQDNTTTRIVSTTAGYYQRELFRGVGTPSITTEVASSGALQTPWVLTKIYQTTLSDVNYTNSHVFPISLTGAGLRALVITIMPITYWGDVGENTYSTWKPGEFLYLS